MKSLLGQSILALAFTCLLGAAAQAATLVMLDWSSCRYCQRFNHEIAPVYSTMPAGQKAPLRRVRVTNGRYTWPADLDAIARPRGTPTFILVHNGREVGRFAGYLGRDWFWAKLNGLLARV